MKVLPEEEQRLLWMETERNWQNEFESEWHEIEKDAEKKYRETTLEIKVKVERLDEQINKTQRSLAKQEEQVKAELSRTVQERDNISNTIKICELNYQKHQQQRLASYKKMRTAMTEFYRTIEEQPLLWQEKVPLRQWSKVEEKHRQTILEFKVEIERLNEQIKETQRSLAEQVQQVEAELSPIVQERDDMVDRLKICDLNHQVHQQQMLAEKEQVRKAMTEYFRNMRGEDPPAESNRAPGDFDKALYQDVGPMQGVVQTGEPVILSQNTNHAAYAAVTEHEGIQSPTNVIIDVVDTNEPVIDPIQRIQASSDAMSVAPSCGTRIGDDDQLSEPNGAAEHTTREEDDMCTPANGRSRPPSHDAPTPTVISTEISPQPNAASSEEITLVFKDDGTFYTSPECVRGVPLAKIDKNHSYWDDSWGDLNLVVKAATRTNSKGKPAYLKKVISKGKVITEFLKNGEISPFQLLNKEFINSGNIFKCFLRLFRLANTLRQLSTKDIGIKPVQWLRHRLYELINEQGDDFNLANTIMNFHKDKKFTALRAKKTPADILTHVKNADGHTIADIRRIQSRNKQVKAILNVPVLRPVQIRRGRTFDMKMRYKWLSCMIQATGIVQSNRCGPCAAKRGPFDACIILGDKLFSKCGNCLWNRTQFCHPESGEAMGISSQPNAASSEKITRAKLVFEDMVLFIPPQNA
jgi:hypothetical protein